MVQPATIAELYINHWGRVRHICVSNLTIIASDNFLSPGWRQTIIWCWNIVNSTLGTHFSEILSESHTFSIKKMHTKMSPISSRSQCVEVGWPWLCLSNCMTWQWQNGNNIRLKRFYVHKGSTLNISMATQYKIMRTWTKWQLSNYMLHAKLKLTKQKTHKLWTAWHNSIWDKGL